MLINGRNVMMGYLNDEPKTVEALSADLLLRTGDFGKRDQDGFLYITGFPSHLFSLNILLKELTSRLGP